MPYRNYSKKLLESLFHDFSSFLQESTGDEGLSVFCRSAITAPRRESNKMEKGRNEGKVKQ